MHIYVATYLDLCEHNYILALQLEAWKKNDASCHISVVSGINLKQITGTYLVPLKQKDRGILICEKDVST